MRYEWHGKGRLAALAVALCVLGLCSAAVTQAVSQITLSNPPGARDLALLDRTDHQLLLNTHGDLDPPTCEVRPLPAIDLEVAPAHGAVCVRRKQETFGGAGTGCTAFKAAAVAVFYVPHRGYNGTDKLRYAVRSDKGPDSFGYTVGVANDVSPTPTMQPGAGQVEPPQPLGLVPPCGESRGAALTPAETPVIAADRVF